MKPLARGAEALLFLENNNIIKERIKKNYRIDPLDNKIRKSTTRQEVRLLEKASALIPVPKIISFDENSFKIIMEFIEGKKLSEELDSFTDLKREEVCKQIGRQTAILHNNDIIHGDLTTSNMILSSKLYFIDFGLGCISTKIEDKAVDLHLLKQALESKHYRHFRDSFNFVLEGYRELSNNYKEIIERLDKVEKRGRYKTKV